MVCSICLDVSQNPVVTPCGHVFCLKCLISSSQRSPDATKAPCPTCRSNFSLVSPEPAFVPEKYRQFIDSNIRRVYFDDSREIALQEKVAQLESRIKSLETDKSLLIARCESHMAAAASHAHREKDARMKCAALQQELKQANSCVAQLVEKEVEKHTLAATNISRSTHTSNTDIPSPINSLRSSTNRSGMLGKRGSTLAIDWPAFPQIPRPALPLPKRRRVSRVRQGPGE